MNDDKLLENPTTRVVASFDDKKQAISARSDLAECGVTDGQVRVLHGEELPDDVDTSAKWFADTDEDIGRYARELRAGKTLISVPLADRDMREKIHDVLRRHDARLITHFGEWITEVMKWPAKRS